MSGRRARRILVCALVAGAAAVAAGRAHAQEAELQVGRGPYWLGSPIDVQVIARGFEEDPEPAIETLAQPAGGTLVYRGVTPNLRSMVTIVNGRMTQERSVEFVYRYTLRAERAGELELGPFRVRQGGRSADTAKRSLRVAPVPLSDRIRVSLELPEDPLYPGQRVPVGIEFAFDAALQDRLHDYVLRSELFDRTDLFRFVDPAEGRSRTRLALETDEGRLELPAEAAPESRDGRGWIVLRARRELIPLRAGRFDLGRARVTVDEVTRWRGRGLFGGRVPAETRRLRAEDRPRTLRVREIPRRGRPPSFGGAVGRDFAVDVSVARSVVRVGDPIELRIRIRGDGNLETAGLPDLAAAGLPAEDFSSSAGGAAGVIEDGAKTFRVSVRPRHAGVDAIPALDYAYFDPERGRFAVAQSRPISLAVREAERVTADDVVTASEASGRAVPDAGDARTAAAPAPDPDARWADALARADLAIEGDPARLRPAAEGAPGLGLALPYALGGLALLAAVALRRRARIDPEAARRARVLARCRAEVAAAAAADPAAALDRVADALREMLRECPGGGSAELDAVLAECDARRYAPAGDARDLDEALARRALAAADALRARADA